MVSRTNKISPQDRLAIEFERRLLKLLKRGRQAINPGTGRPVIGEDGKVIMKPTHLTGVFEPLRKPEFFQQLEVTEGFVTWPGEIDLAPDAMHAAIRQFFPVNQASTVGLTHTLGGRFGPRNDNGQPLATSNTIRLQSIPSLYFVTQ